MNLIKMTVHFYQLSHGMHDLPEKYRLQAEDHILNPTDNYHESIEAPGPVGSIPLIVAGSLIAVRRPLFDFSSPSSPT